MMPLDFNGWTIDLEELVAVGPSGADTSVPDMPWGEFTISLKSGQEITMRFDLPAFAASVKAPAPEDFPISAYASKQDATEAIRRVKAEYRRLARAAAERVRQGFVDEWVEFSRQRAAKEYQGH